MKQKNFLNGKIEIFGVLMFLLAFGLSGVVIGERPVIPTLFTNTPPTLDGQISPGEWNNLRITMTPPTYPIEAYAYFMNDGTYLYILVDAVGDTTHNNSDECYLVFDFANQIAIKVFGDGSKAGTFPASFDAAVGYGTSPNNAANHMIYEIRIPLSMININPGDSIDFCSPIEGKQVGPPSSIVYDANTGLDNIWPEGLSYYDIGTWGILKTYSGIMNLHDTEIKGLNIIDPPNAADICIGRTTTLSANITINATDPNDPLLGNVSLCINVTCPGYVKNETQYLNLTGILSATVTFNVTPTNAGLCNIMTCVDCDNAIPEDNETDNCGNKAFTAVDCTKKHGVPISPLVPLAAVLVLTLIAVSRMRK